MPVSNLSAPIMEAMRRRSQGQNVGRLTEVNPPTATRPSTATTPPPSMGMGGMSPSPRISPQMGAAGVAGAIPGKDENDAKIIEALIAYLRKKVL